MRNAIRLSALFALIPFQLMAQSPSELAVLKGLAPVSALPNTAAGQAALGANFTITGGIQTGAITQTTLLPFPDQQQQALRDAVITSGNLADLADGLGTTLGAAYLARAHCLDRERFTSVSQTLAEVIGYATAVTSAQSTAGKFFFANGTTDGRSPVSPQAQAILKAVQGVTDVYGKSYGLPAGAPGADPLGNSRPFQTEPTLTRVAGLDYFNTPADNLVYNRGPIMNLTASPSFPSGHTTYGYTGALLLAVLVPERYPQMIARGAEYGNDRIILGAHYAMDVLAGRTLALSGMAHLLANDPDYVGQSVRGAKVIRDFRGAVLKAQAELAAALRAGCGNTLAAAAAEDTGRLCSPATNEAFYASTQTYNLPVVHARTAGVREDVARLAPEAGYLLTVAFPQLTLDQADRILTETEGPGGGFLDDGSPFGVYSRLDLYAAARRAAEAAPGK